MRARLGGAVVLVTHGGVDVVHGDVVDGRNAFAPFAGGNEFSDGLGARAGGEGRLAETVVGVEHDGYGAAEAVEAAGVAGAVVVEVDLVVEGGSGVGELDGSVAAEDDDVERRIESDLLLDLEREAAPGGIGLEGGERVPDAELLAEDRDDWPKVLKGDLSGAVLAQIAGFDELTPCHGVGAAAFLAADRGVRGARFS